MFVVARFYGVRSWKQDGKGEKRYAGSNRGGESHGFTSKENMSREFKRGPDKKGNKPKKSLVRKEIKSYPFLFSRHINRLPDSKHELHKENEPQCHY